MINEHTAEQLYNSIFTDYDDVVNVEGLCSMLDISKKSAYQLLSNSEIKSLKIGREYKIPKIYVIDFLTSKQKTS